MLHHDVACSSADTKKHVRDCPGIDRPQRDPMVAAARAADLSLPDRGGAAESAGHREQSMSIPIAILNTGLVTSVGLSAPAACAAIRAGLTNPSTTRFFDPDGKWIKAHQIPLAQPWCGLVRLAKMASMVI